MSPRPAKGYIVKPGLRTKQKVCYRVIQITSNRGKLWLTSQEELHTINDHMTELGRGLFLSGPSDEIRAQFPNRSPRRVCGSRTQLHSDPQQKLRDDKGSLLHDADFHGNLFVAIDNYK